MAGQVSWFKINRVNLFLMDSSNSQWCIRPITPACLIGWGVFGKPGDFLKNGSQAGPGPFFPCHSVLPPPHYRCLAPSCCHFVPWPGYCNLCSALPCCSTWSGGRHCCHHFAGLTLRVDHHRHCCSYHSQPCRSTCCHYCCVLCRPCRCFCCPNGLVAFIAAFL